MIHCWLEHIQTPAICLGIIPGEAARSGLASLSAIVHIIFEHPNFPWHLPQRMYPWDWENVVIALHVVGNNPYL